MNVLVVWQEWNWILEIQARQGRQQCQNGPVWLVMWRMCGAPLRGPTLSFPRALEPTVP
jgi:hypothetical protein